MSKRTKYLFQVRASAGHSQWSTSMEWNEIDDKMAIEAGKERAKEFAKVSWFMGLDIYRLRENSAMYDHIAVIRLPEVQAEVEVKQAAKMKS